MFTPSLIYLLSNGAGKSEVVAMLCEGQSVLGRVLDPLHFAINNAVSADYAVCCYRVVHVKH